jgi:hypothetical protein
VEIAEFFVSLGVKGSEKAVSAIGGVFDRMKKLGTASLETKAAIIGAFYAVEQGIVKAGAMGIALKQFNTLTGLSTKMLQQYQYAGKAVGLTNEQVAQTFTELRTQFRDMIKAGGDAPQYLYRFEQALADVGIHLKPGEEAEWVHHPEELLERMKQFSKFSTLEAGDKEMILSSMVKDPAVVSAIMRLKLGAAEAAAAPMDRAALGPVTINKVADATGKWMQMLQEIEVEFAKFWATDGPEVVKMVHSIVTSLIKFVEALTKFESKTHTISRLLDWMSSHPSAVVAGFAGSQFGGIAGAAGIAAGGGLDEFGILKDGRAHLAYLHKHKLHRAGAATSLAAEWNALLGRGLKPHHHPAKTVHLTQHLHFQHSGTDHHKIAASVKDAGRAAQNITTSNRSS